MRGSMLEVMVEVWKKRIKGRCKPVVPYPWAEGGLNLAALFRKIFVIL